MDNEVDKSNFRQVIIDFPDQFAKALKFAKGVGIKGEYNSVVVCGMGGSALPADIVKTYLDSKGEYVDFKVCRTYDLPVGLSKDSLIIVSSYSGNTEETISCLNEAIEKNLPVVGVSRGGQLKEICEENNIPHVAYPEDGPIFQPRNATGYSVTSMLSILKESGVIGDFEEDIEKVAEFLKTDNFEDKGKEIAEEIKGKVIVVYSADEYERSVARIGKIKFNENSKTQAFYNSFPEMNHNEMVGYTFLQADFALFFVRDPEQHERITKRMDITRGLLAEKGANIIDMDMVGNNVLEKMFSTLIRFDWISYALALINKVDPTPVDMVEDLKVQLKN